MHLEKKTTTVTTRAKAMFVVSLDSNKITNWIRV